MSKIKKKPLDFFKPLADVLRTWLPLVDALWNYEVEFSEGLPGVVMLTQGDFFIVSLMR